MKTTYYWLAINGSSCAMSSFPLPKTVTVTPRPRMIVGFPSYEEAESAQRSLLTAPIAKVRKLMDGWKSRRDLVMKVFKNPESHTRGVTLWQDK